MSIPVEVIERDGFRIRLAMVVTTYVSNRWGARIRELNDVPELDNIFPGFRIIDVVCPSVVVSVLEGWRNNAATPASATARTLLGARTSELLEGRASDNIFAGTLTRVDASAPDVAARDKVYGPFCGP